LRPGPSKEFLGRPLTFLYAQGPRARRKKKEKKEKKQA